MSIVLLPCSKPHRKLPTSTCPSKIPHVKGTTAWSEQNDPRIQQSVQRLLHGIHSTERSLYWTTLPQVSLSLNKESLKQKVESFRDLCHIPKGAPVYTYPKAGTGYYTSSFSSSRLRCLNAFLSNLPRSSAPHYQSLFRHRKLLAHLSFKVDALVRGSSDQAKFLSLLEQDIGSIIKDFSKARPKICYQTIHGERAFCLPTGTAHHFISLLVSRNPKSQKCNLRIFNKGRQPQVNPFVSTKVKAEAKGQYYALSEIEIQNIDASVLLDPKFLMHVITFEFDGKCTIDGLYSLLHQKIITEGGGQVYLHPSELDLSSLQSLAEEDRLKILQKAPHMHHQMYTPVCYAANLTTPEHHLATRKHLRQEKYFRCLMSLNSFKERRWKKNPRIQALADLTEKKCRQLENKLRLQILRSFKPITWSREKVMKHIIQPSLQTQ